MIKVLVKNKEIIVKGHAKYAEYGHDIVCAAASSIVITSINACLKIDKYYLKYTQDQDKLTINILKDNEVCNLIILNMLEMLKELAQDYQKNIEIKEE